LTSGWRERGGAERGREYEGLHTDIVTLVVVGKRVLSVGASVGSLEKDDEQIVVAGSDGGRSREGGQEGSCGETEELHDEKSFECLMNPLDGVECG
jgi:hypothetical protein